MRKFNFHTLNKLYTSPRLRELASDRPLIIASYGITDSYSISVFKQLWAKFDSTTKAVGRNEKNTKRVEGEEVGGAITLIDMNLDNEKEPEILAELDIMNPIGLYYYPETGELLVGTSFAIDAVKGGEVVRRLDNKFFNSIHSIKPSPRGIYVVCTSVDTIVEIDPQDPSENIWEWIAPENGLDTSPRGEHVVIDRKINYQKSGAIGSSHQATHVNGVQHVDDNHVLATLFHQDQLILIDKTTLKYEVVFDNLVNPHGIHRTKKGYLVSDTRGNRVIRLDNEYKVVEIIEEDFNWVQEAIEVEEFVVVANDNNGRLEAFDKENRLVKQFIWDSDKRMISGLHRINAIDALKVFSNE